MVSNQSNNKFSNARI